MINRILRTVSSLAITVVVSLVVPACAGAPGPAPGSAPVVPPIASGGPALVVPAGAPSAGGSGEGPVPGIPSRPAAPDEQGFEVWLAAFADQAVQAGIRRETVERALGGLTVDPGVIEKDRRQPESTLSFLDYLDRSVTRDRVAKARNILEQYRVPLARIEERYGVDARFLAAFWGMETNFGSNMGKNNVFRSLATLAFDGRRASFFRTELMNALRIADSGAADPAQMVGSWAGAMGNFQFMPSTFLSYAVDVAGTGRKDIWGDPETALASAANYLARLGWRHGQSWGTLVRLPADFPWQIADMSIQKPLAEWVAMGVVASDGQALPSEGRGAILLPMGYRGPAFLTFDNFQIITTWNSSLSYALAVGLLADRIAGAPPFAGPRPTDADPLQPQDVIALQNLLIDLGHDPGGADGQIGKKTRAAIRTLQLACHQPADGYPTVALLTAARALAAQKP
ncbi:MAG: lytic murein transglycosylase [Azospirillaceae bacterium]|nr:lytic murein transglycosylase [Azospirillaceae bacterium]